MALKCCYTVITGGYDQLRIPVKADGWDFICFTDSDIKSDKWEIRKIKGKDDVRLSRLPKIKWFEFLDHDITFYIDASFKIIGDLNEFLDEAYVPGHHCAFKHMERNCVYEEAHVLNKVPFVASYVNHLKEIEYPKKQGLYMNGFMIRDKDVPKQPYIDWYADVMKYSYRDQLSFMPNSEGLKIHTIKAKLLKKYFRRFDHKKPRKWKSFLT